MHDSLACLPGVVGRPQMVAGEASDVNKLRAKLPRWSLHTRISTLFSACKRGMVKGGYEPATDPRFTAAVDALAWVQQPPRLRGKPVPESHFIT